jgi:uncharacterized membrane protein
MIWLMPLVFVGTAFGAAAGALGGAQEHSRAERETMRSALGTQLKKKLEPGHSALCLVGKVPPNKRTALLEKIKEEIHGAELLRARTEPGTAERLEAALAAAPSEADRSAAELQLHNSLN